MEEEFNSKDAGNQSLGRLFKIVECLAASRMPQRLLDLSNKLQMPQPTLVRYLRTLCDLGYAYKEEQSGCYALTWKLCRLSDSVRVNLALRGMANPFLNLLANSLNVSSCLVIAHEDALIYLDYVDNPGKLMVTTVRIGKDAPIHSTGSGKIFLSSYSERKVKEIIDRVGLAPLTPHTITNYEALLRELENVRKNGYAVDDEECEEGHKCISVPLYDYSGSVAAAISVFDACERMSEERVQKEILPALRSAAREISFRMGYDHPGVCE